jgi:hypothetical protein
MSESTSKTLRSRALAWASDELDANGNPIINYNRSGHVSSNDPSDSSTARHATAYSVNLVKQQLDSLNSGLTTRITNVVNEKIANGEIATGGGSGSGTSSDVAVVGTPRINGKFAIIGASTDFNVSAYAGLQDSYIASFTVSLTGCTDQTVNATNNSATVSFTVPNSTTVGDELTLTVTAYDNNGNASHAATATITATNAAVAAPSVTTPSVGDVIVYNEGFQVVGTPFALMGAGSDTHANTRIIIRDHRTGVALKTITKAAASVYNLVASDVQNLGHGHQYDICLQYEGTTLGWGVESLPVCVKLNSAIRAPAVIEPVEGGSFFYVASLTVRCAPFTTDFLTDTFVKRTYQLRDPYDNVIVSREVTNEAAYNFGDLSGIISSGPYRLYVKDTGATFGDSEWTGPIAVTSQPTAGITPDLLSPVDGAQVARRASLTITLDEPPTSAGVQSVDSCDFQVCTGADGSGIFMSASESGLSHTFTTTETSAEFELNQTYYARARQNLTNGESTGWGTAVFHTAQEGLVTPSGRVLYAVDSNCLVMEGTYEGTIRKLLIPFAKYRKRQDTKWATSRTLVDGLYQHNSWSANMADGNNYIYRQKDGNGVPQHVYGDTNTLNVGSESVIGPLTDTQLDTWTKPMHQHENKTARECTDIIIAKFGASGAPAASYCRGLTSLHAGGFDLPLMRDLLAMYVEGDYIDSLDPTVADYPTMALGKRGSNTRWMNGGTVWSCQQYNTNFALPMHYNGYANGNYKDDAHSVLPVREI